MFIVALALSSYGRWISFIGITAILIFFLAMTGMEAPVIRAGIMGGLVALAAAIGRFSDVRNIFFLALCLVALFSPKTLQYDLSLFLSASATLGIILLTPLLEKRLSWIPSQFQLRTLLSVTIAAQLAVVPLLGLYFSEVSIFGTFSNLLVEPLIPPAMLSVFILTVLGGEPLIIIKILAMPAFLILESIFWVAMLFSLLPTVVLPAFLSKALLVFVLIFFCWGSFSRKLTMITLVKGAENLKKQPHQKTKE